MCPGRQPWISHVAMGPHWRLCSKTMCDCQTEAERKPEAFEGDKPHDWWGCVRKHLALELCFLQGRGSAWKQPSTVSFLNPRLSTLLFAHPCPLIEFLQRFCELGFPFSFLLIVACNPVCLMPTLRLFRYTNRDDILEQGRSNLSHIFISNPSPCVFLCL